MEYCNVCQSAGSVTRYGFCEICGTKHGAEVEKLLMDTSVTLKEEDYSGINAAA